MRLVNATLTHASINLLANRNAVVSRDGDQQRERRTPTSPAAARRCRSTTPPAAPSWRRTAPSVAESQQFVVVAYESGGAVRTTVIAEGTTRLRPDTASLRVFNAATDAGAVDVYVTDPAVDITTLTSPTFSFTSSTSVQASNFASFGAPAPAGATYRIRVTGAGNPVGPAPRHPERPPAQPAGGGADPHADYRRHAGNGSVLIEDGQVGVYAPPPTPAPGCAWSPRSTNGASVSATAVSAAASAPIAIGTNVVAPAVGSYVSVPDGSAINVTVNGASVGAPAGTLSRRQRQHPAGLRQRRERRRRA